MNSDANRNKSFANIDKESVKQLGKLSVEIKSGKPVPEMDVEPLNDKVIVQIAKVYESSLIEIPPAAIEDELHRQVSGVLLACGEASFYENKKNNEKHPEIGDIVYFAKYSGRLHTDVNTGNEYRILLDTDIHYRKRG